MDFWDYFMINTMMNVRDYHRDKMREEEKVLEFQHKICSEISNEIVEMIELITGVFEKANPYVLPKEILDGARMLPYYMFGRVLSVQGSSPTKAQNIMLDACFRTIKVKMTKREFLTDNKVMAEMHELVGLTSNHLGNFWSFFLKAMYATNSEVEIVEKVGQHAASIMMRFAVLGNASEDTTERVCENFLKDLIQYGIGVATAPIEDIDYLGEASFLQHKKKARDLAMDLVCDAGSEDELPMVDLMDIYFVKLLYDLVNSCNLPFNDKVEILAKAMEMNEDDVGMTAKEIFEATKHQTERGQQLESIGDLTPTIINSLGARTRREDDAVTFFQESINYLIGIEKELANMFPRSGLGRKAGPMMSKKIDSILESLQ